MAAVDVGRHMGIVVASGKPAAPFAAAPGGAPHDAGTQTGPALKLHVGFQGIVYCHPGESPYRLIQHVGHILVVLGGADLVQDAVDAVLVHRDALGQQAETGRFVELLLYGSSGVSHQCMVLLQQGAEDAVGDVPVHPSIRKRVGAEMETERLGQSAADKVSVVQSRRVSGRRRSSVPQQAEKVGPDAPQQRGGNILLVHLLIPRPARRSGRADSLFRNSRG